MARDNTVWRRRNVERYEGEQKKSSFLLSRAHEMFSRILFVFKDEITVKDAPLLNIGT